MGRYKAAKSEPKPALLEEFMKEAERLTQLAGRRDLAEGVMRLRALVEIADALTTEALLELAVAVTVTAPAPVTRGAGRSGTVQ